ncbi:MAG: glycosyltransferase [Bacteroidota bacterium]|nr:glycosyltransferase [Bacteroidota bacterium]
MKKVLVVDWLDKYGGAERVIATLNKTFVFDKTYTLVNVMDDKDLQKIYHTKNPIVTTWLQYLGKYFRAVFFLFHKAVERIDVDKDTDFIISSSHSIAKGVRKSTDRQLHISYFQARNFKYIWEDTDLYFKKASFFLKPILPYLRKKDVCHAQNPDYIISNSKFVQKWVKERYNRESEVIYPPVELEKFPLCTQKEDYYVAVGRIVAYKRFDLIVEAFNQLDKKLVIVGDGAALSSIRPKANHNILFTGFLESSQVYDYISKAKGFIHIGVEDFGIAPIEAQSCGTPVIAYGKGGILETVKQDYSGVFFYEQTPESLVRAINKAEAINWDYTSIHQHAQQFSEKHFIDNFQKFVQDKLKNNNYSDSKKPL